MPAVLCTVIYTDAATLQTGTLCFGLRSGSHQCRHVEKASFLPHAWVTDTCRTSAGIAEWERSKSLLCKSAQKKNLEMRSYDSILVRTDKRPNIFMALGFGFRLRQRKQCLCQLQRKQRYLACPCVHSYFNAKLYSCGS